MKKDAMISIKGIQRVDGEQEVVELLTCGRFYRRNNSYWLSYQESEATGFEGHRTTLHVEPNRVTMQRSGPAQHPAHRRGRMPPPVLLRHRLRRTDRWD